MFNFRGEFLIAQEASASSDSSKHGGLVIAVAVPIAVVLVALVVLVVVMVRRRSGGQALQKEQPMGRIAFENPMYSDQTPGFSDAALAAAHGSEGAYADLPFNTSGHSAYMDIHPEPAAMSDAYMTVRPAGKEGAYMDVQAPKPEGSYMDVNADDE